MSRSSRSSYGRNRSQRYESNASNRLKIAEKTGTEKRQTAREQKKKKEQKTRQKQRTKTERG